MSAIPIETFFEFGNGENTCLLSFVISPTDIPHFHLRYLIKPRDKTIFILLNIMWIAYFTEPYTEHITSQNLFGK